MMPVTPKPGSSDDPADQDAPDEAPEPEDGEETAATPAAKPAADSSSTDDTEAIDTPLPGDKGKEKNPLNPIGDDLQQILELQINADLWRQVRGRLPCTEPTQQCIEQLQGLAVTNAKPLKALDERIQLVSEKVDDASKNNKKSVSFGSLAPVLQEWLKYEPATATAPAKGGLISNVFKAIANPTNAVNQILSLIGLPLFQQQTGGSSDAQSRAISITDIQTKLITLKASREEQADKLRAQVTEELLQFDDARREFQASKAHVTLETTRVKILSIEYRLGKGDTGSWLTYKSALDQKRVDHYRAWSKVRGRLQRLKLLCLGSPDENSESE